MRRVRPLQVETLEGKILLSSGIVDPSRSVQITAAKSFAFNSTLYVGFIGHHSLTSNQGGIFAIGGVDAAPFKPMGSNVRMWGPLGHAQALTAGVLPDLSNTRLSLTNAKGSLTVSLSPSATNTYRFTISGRAGQFVTADGTTGIAVFTFGPHGYQIRFKSDNHRP
jgi:hypothetical protein